MLGFKILSLIFLLVIALSFVLIFLGVISMIIHLAFFIDDLIDKKKKGK
jgi:hypothetical protein